MGDEAFFEAARRPPGPALRGLIAGYQGYRHVGPPGRHAGLPSPYLTMIVTLDEPLTIARHPDPRQPPGAYPTLLGGLHTAPALIAHDGRQAGIQLDVSPLGVRALTGVPAGELAALDLDGVEIFGPVADELRDRVARASTWAERFTVLDDLLSRHSDPVRRVRPELARAWTMLTGRGSSRVDEVAREVGWSERHLRQRFRAEFGVGPAGAIRVGRFDRARRDVGRRAASGAPLALAEVAVEHGYFDQAHLAREFREFAGAAPTRWVADEFRYVQAASGCGAGRSSHD